MELYVVIDTKGAGRVLAVFDRRSRAEELVACFPSYYRLHVAALNEINPEVLDWVDTRFEFGWDHLFVVEERVLEELRALRQSQNYFSEDVVLRRGVLGEIVDRSGPGSVVIEDMRFNMTVLGAGRRGALIIARPRR